MIIVKVTPEWFVSAFSPGNNYVRCVRGLPPEAKFNNARYDWTEGIVYLTFQHPGPDETIDVVMNSIPVVNR